ncbi:hypothetical protein [Parvibaculum sp.]|uniref:hypothetical protein n=1 Tax=Parvibaculum sp. TaxID=2024848 RepID=UPI00391A9A8F
MTRTREIEVTFLHPFRLSNFPNEAPAGVYRVEIDEEEIGGMSHVGTQRTATLIHLPALGVKSPVHTVYSVSREELELAQKMDMEAGAARG